MLRRLTSDHHGVTKHYYLDIPLAETQRRHLSKDIAVPSEKLAEWYHERDLLGVNNEGLIGVDESRTRIVERILGEVGFPEPPICARLQPEAHLA